jgi:BirA family transcriptional regulator, biotin operon repressor / biotin---[acetyl-CoA-carboxylase] ligase
MFHFIYVKIMTIGSKIIFIDNLTSTNTYAIRLSSEERPSEGTIIRTNFQSAGRGQPGNKWESEDGKNLLISIILYPSRINPADQFLVSMSLSLGMHDYLGSVIPGCSIKWPNDIYINDDKIAGILIESAITGSKIDYMVAGIGMNINQEKFTGDAPNPVSLRNLTNREYDLASCLSDLSAFLDRRYNDLRKENYRAIKDEYLSKLYRSGKPAEFRDSEGVFEGTISDVDYTGRMTIKDSQGKKRFYYFKEVDFIP